MTDDWRRCPVTQWSLIVVAVLWSMTDDPCRCPVDLPWFLIPEALVEALSRRHSPHAWTRTVTRRSVVSHALCDIVAQTYLMIRRMDDLSLTTGASHAPGLKRGRHQYLSTAWSSIHQNLNRIVRIDRRSTRTWTERLDRWSRCCNTTLALVKFN